MKPGDPITLVDGDLLVHVRVHGTHNTVDHRVFMTTTRRGLAGEVDGPRLVVADEHVTWCRGHVTPNDEAGAALLAASMMKPSKAMPLDAAEEAFKRGHMNEEAWLANLDLWDAEFNAGLKGI